MKAPSFWQTNNWIVQLLRPLSFLYQKMALHNQQKKLLTQQKLPVPVIVVGNINVGGTGKTPVTISLINELHTKGYKVGLISRGYGRRIDNPKAETVVSEKGITAELLGDEPYLIHQKTAVPVAVSSKRYDAGIALLEKYPDLDLIISDDGLQHYALYRDFEIVVFGMQGVGNGYVMPAGPLRESVDRLNSVDAILTIDEKFKFLLPYSEKCYKIAQRLGVPYQLNNSKQTKEWMNFSHVSAVAGIAHPSNFFQSLSSKTNLKITQYPFADHHAYCAEDFTKMAEPILMTEKDAVKCMAILHNHDAWVVPLETELSPDFIEKIIEHISAPNI